MYLKVLTILGKNLQATYLYKCIQGVQARWKCTVWAKLKSDARFAFGDPNIWCHLILDLLLEMIADNLWMTSST